MTIVVIPKRLKRKKNKESILQERLSTLKESILQERLSTLKSDFEIKEKNNIKSKNIIQDKDKDKDNEDLKQQLKQGLKQITDTQKQMTKNLQEMLSKQDETFSVLNNIRTTQKKTNTRTLKNIMCGVFIYSVKMALKAAFFGYVGMPWYFFKGYLGFSLSGGKKLFGPFLTIISIMFFIMTLGNVCYIVTIPYEDFFYEVPNKHSVIQHIYPPRQTGYYKKDDPEGVQLRLRGLSKQARAEGDGGRQARGRVSDTAFSMVNQFKNDVINVTDVMDLSYIDFKYHSEAYNILNNRNYMKIYFRDKKKIPQIVWDQFYSLNPKIVWHLLLDITVNVKRPYAGYQRVIDEILKTNELIAIYDTAAFTLQKSRYDTCWKTWPALAARLYCGSDPPKPPELPTKQKKYTAWRECNDYNDKLNHYTSFWYKRNCGTKPAEFAPMKKLTKRIWRIFLEIFTEIKDNDAVGKIGSSERKERPFTLKWSKERPRIEKLLRTKCGTFPYRKCNFLRGSGLPPLLPPPPERSPPPPVNTLAKENESMSNTVISGSILLSGFAAYFAAYFAYRKGRKLNKSKKEIKDVEILTNVLKRIGKRSPLIYHSNYVIK